MLVLFLIGCSRSSGLPLPQALEEGGLRPQMSAEEVTAAVATWGDGYEVNTEGTSWSIRPGPIQTMEKVEIAHDDGKAWRFIITLTEEAAEKSTWEDLRAIATERWGQTVSEWKSSGSEEGRQQKERHAGGAFLFWGTGAVNAAVWVQGSTGAFVWRDHSCIRLAGSSASGSCSTTVVIEYADVTGSERKLLPEPVAAGI